jgi:hypothetical protein
MTMTTRQLTKRTLSLAALAAATLAAGSVDARDPVITVVSGLPSDPTTNESVQSETACAISFFPSDKRQIEVISANDETSASGFFYDNANRAVIAGASEMGWYFRERTTADPNPVWQHGRLVPGSGNATGIDVLWGDPGVAAAPDAPNLMLMGSLVVPHAKFPATTCTIGGVSQPCILGSVAGGCSSPLGGACVARSLDGGKTFTMQHCFSDTSPGSCTGAKTDSTLGHFYDGFDAAIGNGAAPPAAVAMRDVDTSKEALWMMTNGVTDSTFTLINTNVGPLGALGDDKQHIDIHVRLRYDVNNQLWRMSPDTEQVTVNGQTVVQSIIKVNILGRNAPAKGIASDYTALSAVNVNDVPKGANDPDAKLQASVRFGPEFDFDVGVNDSGANEMRFAYVATDPSGNSYIQAGFCSFDLTNCQTPKEWRSSANLSLRHFHPAIKYGHDTRGNRHFWKVTYYELTPDGKRVAVIATDLLRNGTGSFGAVPFNPVAVVPASYQAPCPDSRGVPSTDPSKPSSDADDYWGDYDDMIFNPQQCSFVRSFTDSHLGCVNRRGFTATHQHIGAVEIPCPFDPASRRRVEFDFTLWINDDDFGDPDECATWGTSRSDCDNHPEPKHALCDVDANNRDFDQQIVEECVDDEVVGQVQMKCKLLDDDRTVRVTMNPILREGTSCGSHSFHTDNPFDFDAQAGGFAILTGPLNAIGFSSPSNGSPYDVVELTFPDAITNVEQP